MWFAGLDFRPPHGGEHLPDSLPLAVLYLSLRTIDPFPTRA